MSGELAVSHQVTRKVALVGKTVCFDTGGYSLKVGLARSVAPHSHYMLQLAPDNAHAE